MKKLSLQITILALSALCFLSCTRETPLYGLENQNIKIHFPEDFKGGTQNLSILSRGQTQSFLFCCQIQMELPRSALIHLKLNESESYSPLNHTTSEEKICAYLGEDKVRREKNALGQTHLLDVKATLLVGRDEEIPQGKVRNCQLLNITENHFASPLFPYTENYLRPKNLKQKRVLFLGGSNFIDQGGFDSPSFIAEKISEQNSLRPFETLNLSVPGSTLMDFTTSWERILILNEKNYIKSSVFSYKRLPQETPFLIKTDKRGIKDLKGDLLVLSSLWHDFPYHSLLFNASVPLILDYLSLLKEASLSPSDHKTEKLAELYKTISKLPPLDDETRIAQMGEVYTVLLKDFIKKVRKSSPDLPILLVQMPLGLNESFLDKELIFKSLRESKLFTNIYGNEFNLTYWSMVEIRQTEILKKIAQEFKNVDLLNLSQEYTENFSLVSSSRILNHNYFLEDLAHFSPAGNAFVGTRLEGKIRELLQEKQE